jgi:hypothetical protein
MRFSTILVPSQSVSASGNSADIDVTGLTTLLVVITVSAQASFNTTYSLQVKTFDKTYHNVTTTAALVANGDTLITLGVGTTLGDFGNLIRFAWVRSAGSATVVVYGEGK